MKKFFLVVVILSGVIACQKSSPTTDPPAILDFSPKTGSPGIFVQINGHHFDSVAAKNKVLFNGVSAEVKAVYPDSVIWVKVPEGVNTGKISVVTNGQTATSAADFILLEGGTWRRIADFPDPSGRMNAISFAIDGKGYVGMGGYDLSPGGDMFMFDPVSGTWTQKASPVEKMTLAGVVVLNGKAYAGIGYNGQVQQSNSKRFFEYDATKNIWTEKASFPGTERMWISAIALDGKGYFGMGFVPVAGSYYSNEFWEYDAVADQWAKLEDLSFVKNTNERGFAFSVNDSIGFFGASDPYKVPYLYQYNARSKTWTRKNDLPFQVQSGMSVMVIQNKPYINSLQEFWSYDWKADTWHQEPMFDMKYTGAAFAIGDHGYLGVGHGIQLPPQFLDYFKNDFWEFTPDH